MRTFSKRHAMLRSSSSPVLRWNELKRDDDVAVALRRVLAPGERDALDRRARCAARRVLGPRRVEPVVLDHQVAMADARRVRARDRGEDVVERAVAELRVPDRDVPAAVDVHALPVAVRPVGEARRVEAVVVEQRAVDEHVSVGNRPDRVDLSQFVARRPGRRRTGPSRRRARVTSSDAPECEVAGVDVLAPDVRRRRARADALLVRCSPAASAYAVLHAARS